MIHFPECGFCGYEMFVVRSFRLSETAECYRLLILCQGFDYVGRK